MDENKETTIEKVVKEYFNPDKVISIEKFGTGLINDTYIVKFKEIRYILQKINDYVFQSPIGVMYNIDLITEYIRNRVIYEGENYRNSTLTLVKSKLNKNFVIVNDDEYWRCYTWIDGKTYDSTTDPEIFCEAGRAVGRFQNLLNGFHTRFLTDNIKNFHNTPYRYETFLDVVKIGDNIERVKECKKEIEFIKKRSNQMDIITQAINEKRIPRRVVHNDTKLNNIMFEKNGKKALCLIDLDTAMKGSLVYDYGDALRLGASTAAEDEVDLKKVHINFELVKAFTYGFLETVKEIIEEGEIKLLLTGYFTMTLELGMRFLTDYLDGDKYFALNEEQKEKRPKINLERARNQLKLVSEIEKHYDELNQIIQETLVELGYRGEK